MSYNLQKIERSTYKLAGWLGLVGGFMSSIRAIFLIFCMLVSTWSLEKYLITHLYHTNNESQTNLKTDGSKEKGKTLIE